jgi:hypothetical protein
MVKMYCKNVLFLSLLHTLKTAATIGAETLVTKYQITTSQYYNCYECEIL